MKNTFLAIAAILWCSPSFAETLLDCSFDIQVDGVPFAPIRAQVMATSAPGSYVTDISYRDSTVDPDLISPPMSKTEAEAMIQSTIPIATVAGDDRRMPVIYQTVVSIVKTSTGVYGLQSDVQDWENNQWVADSSSVDTASIHCQTPSAVLSAGITPSN
jgi:hypothetical protein